MKSRLYGINFAPELTGMGNYTGELAANPALRQRLGAAGFAHALAHLDQAIWLCLQWRLAV
jgi:hypothetical protein